MPLQTLDVVLRPPIAEIRVRAGARDTDTLLRDIDLAAEMISGAADVRAALLVFFDAAFDDVPRAYDGLPFRSLEVMPQPVIAVIEGGVSGAMCELALACDIRVVSANAWFSLDAATRGEAIALGGTQRLPRLIGRTRASEIVLLGERTDASTALQWGLANAVTPPGGALDRAYDIAASIASRGPLAVRYAKEAIARGLDMPLEQALRYETDLTIILQTTADRAEGVRAFLEKRKPQFRGD